MAVERRTSWAIRVLAMVAAIAATLPACGGGGGGAGDAEGTTSPATSLGVASTSVSESAAETTGSLSEEPTTGESVASDPPVSGEVGGGQRGIRTLGRLSPTHAFQACAIDHSATCPFHDIARGLSQAVGRSIRREAG